ncbi:SDR family NAD(P)-dependent oxidoreductase [Subtercola boreus]|uniref:Short-chain dehydrogenase n=1 Tax=Subtercola boreus TaxID=120213 RepID=A0A3E0WEG3_9MICO|nr:SDR family NAD(P)-dependent oxidoreductase [Subtercola boreus]RFA23612.1 short-chain dehydrogenase [Subtercola boreus]RFA24006.1 short-chain dehydrogenase [Subtercola boreus]RFA29704.1 short-chain dehydrogenase [Subtercola boreus]
MVLAMVTGGTSGIGAAFARALANRGDDLVIVARDQARLDETALALRTEYGVEVEIISADLADRADVVRVAARLSDATRPVGLLVNNAGFGVHTSLLAEDTTPHERALDVMVRAVLMLGAAAGRAMRTRGTGSIINVSSVAGFITMGSYSAVKAWVASYSQGLAVELAGSGVRVTTLCPGWVRTEFHSRAGIRESSIPEFLWVDVDELVAACLADAAKGKVMSVPSRRFKFLMFVIKHAPRGGIRWASGRISSSRKD